LELLPNEITMAIQQTPFRPYNEKKKGDSFTIWLNEEERRQLEEWKKLIRQPKDSTAVKQLATIGAKLIERQETKEIIEVLFNNDRKNTRTGINDYT